MPTYEYRCTDCGHDLEAVQKFSDDPLTECPACGGRLRKVYNAVGIVFKGSGFYATDSRASSAASPAPSPSGDAGGASKDAAGSAGNTSGSAAGPSTNSTTPKDAS